MSSIEAFFAFARERHHIYLRRNRNVIEPGVSPVVDGVMANSLPGPWTTDPILATYRFTNVFRQLDRTTKWYTENVRDPIMDEPSRHWHNLLLATVVFRWFNRITTGEAIFSQQYFTNETAWETLLNGGNTNHLLHAIKAYCGAGPYVTGAYIIKTPDGYSKLDGVLKCIEWFMEKTPDELGWEEFGKQMAWRASKNETALQQFSLESVWAWLKQFPFLGDFMAYEIVTDLRWSILSNAPDIMTWANPGPGATRGIGRVFFQDKDTYNQHRHKDLLIEKMRSLLEYSKDAGFWPQKLPHMENNSAYSDNCEYDRRFGSDGDWPAWEMRDVEHTLCEFDKYERVRTGEGRPRGRFA